jgi:hypothetical protein
MRRKFLFAAVALSVPLLTATSQARPNVPIVDGDPDTPIYCNYGNMQGTADFTNADGSPGGISSVPARHHYTISIEADCPATAALRPVTDPVLGPLQDTVQPILDQVGTSSGVPASDDAGHYSVTLTGLAKGASTVPSMLPAALPSELRSLLPDSPGETCAHGENDGPGTITGTGPEGPINGTFAFHREGFHYWISGTFDSASETHRFWFWTDLVPSTALPPVSVVSLSQVINGLRQQTSAFCQTGEIVHSPVISHAGIFDPGDPVGEGMNIVDGGVMAVLNRVPQPL